MVAGPLEGVLNLSFALPPQMVQYNVTMATYIDLGTVKEKPFIGSPGSSKADSLLQAHSVTVTPLSNLAPIVAKRGHLSLLR